MSSLSKAATHMFRAFSNRNYRLFFIGQGLSFTGNWMMQVGMGWLVYRLTDSTFMLGLVAFSSLFPSIITAPLAGLACDRFEKRKIIIAADAVLAFCALLLGALAFTRVIMPWHVVAISVLAAAANGFEMTTRHSLVPEIVDDRELMFNAISLNSALFNLARLVGPVLAGIIVGLTGEWACFAAYGLGNAAAITTLALMKFKKRKAAVSAGPLKDLVEGAKYVAGKKPLRNTIITVFIACLFGLSPFVLMPAVAKDILKGGPDTLGFLMGATGIGAVLGAFFLAGRKRTEKLPVYQFAALVCLGAGLVAMWFADNIFAAAAMLSACGFGMIMFLSANNTTIQSLADDRLRGRATSFYIMSFSAAAPLGNLFAGWLAGKWNVPAVFLFGGILTLAAAAWFYLMVMKDTAAALGAAGKAVPIAAAEDI